MKIEPVISRITIYPVKSLDGIALQKAVITEGGCLLHDREYAISDEAGNFITAKRNPLIHLLRSAVDIEKEIISFRPEQETSWTHFHLQKERPAIQTYLGNYFGFKTLLHQDTTGRFMDIPDTGGATVLSTPTLQEVASWYNNMNLDETRKRFRATIEIEGVPAFWEDHLFSTGNKRIEFKVGDVTLFGMAPRERCIVPTRQPETGEVIHAFPKSFATNRAASLPQWSALETYGHYYYLSVDCYIPSSEIGKTIETGNKLTIIGEKVFG